MRRILFPLFGLLVVLSTSCWNIEKTDTEIIDEWIWDVMSDVYLWADDLNWSMAPEGDEDPETYFYSLLNENDRFSWIVDDYQALLDEINNVGLSSGISPYFIRIIDTDQLIIVVEYVTRGSPAEVAGIERGDIIYQINDSTITIDNYIDLFYSEEITMKFADYTLAGLFPNGKEITVTAQELETNPVQHFEIINSDEHKIGYLVYTGFSEGLNGKWINELDIVLSEFITNGIDNLIVDLRYNPGGTLDAARHLASELVPPEVINSKSAFVKYVWNDKYQNYFMRQEGDDSEELVTYFDDQIGINLGLSHIYFLVSGHSASASELIIVGLDPYMDVTVIGENTYGKCYGSVPIPDIEDPPRHTWAMLPIVFKYSNANGYTDFVDGLQPDIYLEDNILQAKPFGDMQDPLLARAIEKITGISPLLKKSEIITPKYEVLPDPVKEKKLKRLGSSNSIKLPIINEE